MGEADESEEDAEGDGSMLDPIIVSMIIKRSALPAIMLARMQPNFDRDIVAFCGGSEGG